MGKVYVCSDIHGDWIKYENAIKALKEDDTLYILGDATDRGDYGIKILQDIMRRKESKQGPKVEYVLGNHDITLMNAIVDLISLDINSVNTNDLDKKYGEIVKKELIREAIIFDSNGVKITIQDIMKMSLKEQKKLLDFFEKSYVQVVVGNPAMNGKCPNKFVLAHNIPPIRQPKRYTYEEALESIKNGVQHYLKESKRRDENKILKATEHRIRDSKGAYLYGEEKTKAEKIMNEEYKVWKEKGFFTIIGHTPDMSPLTGGTIDFSEELNLLNIDTSKHIIMPVVCLNDRNSDIDLW